MGGGEEGRQLGNGWVGVVGSVCLTSGYRVNYRPTRAPTLLAVDSTQCPPLTSCHVLLDLWESQLLLGILTHLPQKLAPTLPTWSLALDLFYFYCLYLPVALT